MGILNAPNNVPKNQRAYQAAYRQHVRIWNIAPKSRLMLYPFYALLGGATVLSTYGMGRKVLGYSSYA